MNLIDEMSVGRKRIKRRDASSRNLGILACLHKVRETDAGWSRDGVLPGIISVDEFFAALENRS